MKCKQSQITSLTFWSIYENDWLSFSFNPTRCSQSCSLCSKKNETCFDKIEKCESEICIVSVPEPVSNLFCHAQAIWIHPPMRYVLPSVQIFLRPPLFISFTPTIAIAEMMPDRNDGWLIIAVLRNQICRGVGKSIFSRLIQSQVRKQ